MPRIPILGGSYNLPSLIAGAQRSVNLFCEFNPEKSQAPVNTTHYVRPGLTPLGAPGGVSPLGAPLAPGRGRGLYASTTNRLFAVVDQTVYYITPDWAYVLLGQLATPATTPVYMSDNGTTLMGVDGSQSGFLIDLTATQVAGAFSQIGDANFLGADRVDFIDGFLVLNKPGTTEWYSTTLLSAAFNGLYVGVKTASPDPIQTVLVIGREVWLFGTRKSEVWVNAGAFPFPFQILPGVMVEHGCAAKYSVARNDIRLYWLSNNPEGGYMAMKSDQHGAVRISTSAVEAEWRRYPTITDAIGGCYQMRGHNFYKLHFPLADKTWGYDEATNQWHEDNWIDINGVLRRSRTPFYANAYGQNVALDWSTGQLYKIDQDNFSDNGNPIACIRSLPHLIDDEDDRTTHWRVIADVEVGTTPNTVQVPTPLSPWSSGFSPGFGPITIQEPPLMSLRVSRDRGGSWGNKVMQVMGAAGLYNNRPTWRRLGYGVDYVFELSWSTPFRTALNGVFDITEKHEADSD